MRLKPRLSSKGVNKISWNTPRGTKATLSVQSLHSSYAQSRRLLVYESAFPSLKTLIELDP